MPTFASRWWLSVLMVVVVACATVVPARAAGDASRTFKPEELEQLVATVALYPDAVLSQVLMASTYPLEVVQAERWAARQKNLTGDQLTALLEKEDWDPSVKSLVNFPQVLMMMSEQLDWTTKLGDAFIADQAAVLAAVQRLRAKAKAQGTLKDSQEQKITVEQAPPAAATGAAPQVIVIQPADPEVVYVPAYDPVVVYGAWPYPAYPPWPPYYPPGYRASNLVSFGAGVAVGFAWGYAWGHCDWHHGDVDIDIDRNADINRNINRESYRKNVESRTANAQGKGTFQHDPSHRKGVSYRDQATANRVHSPTNLDAAKARESYRGRADAGRQDIARGGADQFRQGNPLDRNTPTPRVDPGRSGTPGAGRSGGSDVFYGSSRMGSGGGDAFRGSSGSGSSARSDSSRGQASRSSPSPSRSSSPSRSAPGRGGGGIQRGGGGGGGRR